MVSRVSKMSFKCNSCHKVATGKPADEIHFFKSYGPCETCGIKKTCLKCHCNGDWTKARNLANEN